MKKQLTFQEFSDLVMAQAKAKGFGTTAEELNIPEKFALIHSEVSEAFEAYRHKDFDSKDGVAFELGDVLQRVFHLAGCMGIDLEAAVLQKMENNKTRTWDWDAMNESHAEPKK